MSKDIAGVKRDYSKFFTPDHIARYMVGLVNIKPGEVVLEPSAGHGVIVRAIKEHCPSCLVFAFEINKGYKPYLKNAGADVAVIKDFLEIPVVAHVNHCIANPPFGNGINLQDHFDKICEHVKPGGKVVMIVPKDFNPTYGKHYIHNYTVHTLENWSKNSDGTTTEIKIIEFINP